MIIANLIVLANTPTPGLALPPLRVIISLPVVWHYSLISGFAICIDLNAV